MDLGCGRQRSTPGSAEAPEGGSCIVGQEKLLADLAAVWEESWGGRPIPVSLLRSHTAAARRVHLGGGADPATSTMTSGHLRRVIDLIQLNAKGAELGPVLETIEIALRADAAEMIEAE